MFATLKSAVRSHKFADLTAFPYVVSGETSIFDLSMTVIEDVDRQWWAQIEYNTNLFRQERISRMLSDYTSILTGVVSDPDSQILSLPIASLPSTADDSNSAAEQGRRERQVATRSASTRRAPKYHSEPLDGDHELLVEIWKEVFGLPKVGIRDSFFDLGGHSLLAVRLVAQIREITGRQIPVSAIFRAPTIEEFAPLLRENVDNQPDPVLLKLQEGDGIVPFFAIAAPGVDTFGLSLLARHMGNNQSVYKVQGHAPVVWGRPFTRRRVANPGAGVCGCSAICAAPRSLLPGGHVRRRSDCPGSDPRTRVDARGSWCFLDF